MNKLRTRHMALILSVAAIAAAGCGSSSKSKTTAAPATTPATPSTPSTGTGTTAVPSALKAQLTAAIKPFATAGAQVTSNPQSVKSPATWTTLANALRQSAKNVAGVSGIPASDQAQVKQFVSLLNQGAAVADQLAKDLQNNDQAAFKSDLSKWTQVFNQIKAL